VTNKYGGIQTQIVGRVTRYLNDNGVPTQRLRLNPRGDLDNLNGVVLIHGQKEDEVASDEQIEEWLSIAEMKAQKVGLPHFWVIQKRRGHMHAESWFVITKQRYLFGEVTVRFLLRDWVLMLQHGCYDS
jgi:hypothetical protein